MKILTVVGARPQFIKTAPLSAELNITDLVISSNKGVHKDSLYGDGTAGKQIIDILLT